MFWNIWTPQFSPIILCTNTSALTIVLGITTQQQFFQFLLQIGNWNGLWCNAWKAWLFPLVCFVWLVLYNNVAVGFVFTICCLSERRYWVVEDHGGVVLQRTPETWLEFILNPVFLTSSLLRFQVNFNITEIIIQKPCTCRLWFPHATKNQVIK